MKKILLLSILFIVSLSINAQNLGAKSNVKFNKKIKIERIKHNNQNQDKTQDKNTQDLHWAKILNENFEIWPPTDWGIYTLGEGDGWKSNTETSHSGTSCAFHDWGVYSATTNDWLVTPALTIDNNAYALNFWEYCGVGDYNLHKVVVLDGANPTTATELEVLYSEEGTLFQWIEKEFSLSAYNGQTIYIGFYYEGVPASYNDRWRIDDVIVGYPAVNDLAPDTITPTWVMSGTAAVPEVTVHNYGQVSETNYSVQLTDGAGYNKTVTNPGTITAENELIVQFPNWTPADATYTLTATVIVATDEVPENNTITNQCIVEARYFMSNNNYTICSGRFFDSGGLDDNFSANEDYTMTISSGDVSKMASVNFVSFDCGNFSDRYLEIYNGTSTSAPLIISSNNTNNGTDMLQTFTADNTDGALTFHFVCSEYILSPGWDANISCLTVPNVDMGIETLTPSLAVSGENTEIKVKIVNHGLNNATTWNVNVTDGNSYNETVTNPGNIEFLDTITVDMPTWIPASGYYTLTASVTITDDSNTTNNQLAINGLAHGGFSNYAVGGNTEAGIFNRVNLSDGNTTQIGTIADSNFPMADEYALNGIIYRLRNDKSISTVNQTNGNETVLGNITGASNYTPTGLAYDWIENKMYISLVDESNDITHIGTINMANYAYTEIGTITSTNVIAIDFANDGFLYAVDLYYNKLIRIDKSTFDIVEIGYIGIEIGFGQDITFDRQAGLLLTITNQISEDQSWENKYGYYDLTDGKFHEIKHMGTDQYATIACYERDEYVATFNISNGNNMLENAIININGNNLQTNSVGAASIILFAGNYPFTVNYAGYDEYSNTLTVTNANETLNIILNETVLVNNISENKISIYPNPTTGQFTIDLRGSARPRSVEITDITGKLIKQLSIDNHQLSIDFENQPSGIYFMEIQTENNIIIKKIIKN